MIRSILDLLCELRLFYCEENFASKRGINLFSRA